MPTDAEIGNMALSRLGTTATIADLAENSTEARQINAWYSVVRDDLLGKIDWSFARVYQALAQSGTPPARWAYSYAYPSDCLKIWRLDFGSSVWVWGSPTALFEIASDGSNSFLYCNDQQALAVYSQRVTDPNRFSAAFTLAFVETLAARIAYPITQKRDVAQTLLQSANMILEDAMADAANEQQTADKDRVPDSIAVRGYEGFMYPDYPSGWWR